MIKAALFDMDGVLCDTEPYHKLARDELMKKYNVFDDEQSRAAVGMGLKRFWQYVIDNNGLKADAEELTLEIFRNLAKLAYTLPFKPMGDVIPLMKELKSRGLKIGVASSSYRVMVDAVLDVTGIKDYADVVVTGDEVEDVKPTPFVYAEALKRCGVSPDEAFAVEDSRTGATGALNAGIKTVIAYRPDGGFSNLQNMDICRFKIKKFMEITDILENL